MTPDDHTNQEFFLDVGDGHQLYVQDWGNPKAKTPIIFLHGGPGSGVKDKYKTNFNPGRQRIIFHDQRGAGKSLPYGKLENNTTDDLIADIKSLADHLKLKAFIIAGGSWGSCLGLAYALKHPARVKALVLRGIFTGSKAEIDWINRGHFRHFFPEVWQDYQASAPASYSDDPFEYHAPRILGGDEKDALESAYAQGNVEGPLMSLDDRYNTPDKADYDPISMRIQTHYMLNDCFMEERYILSNAHKLKMPVVLIQGRYDMVCPPVTAYELHQALPDSQLIWTVAGHGNDRPTYDVYRAILERLAEE